VIDAGAGGASQNDARRILQSAELRDVGTRRFGGARFSEKSPDSVELELTTNTSSVARELDFSVESRCRILDEQKNPVAEITAELIVRYRIPDEVEFEAPPDLGMDGERRALRVAYPYLRETIQSLAARLGLPGLVLGAITADALRDAPAEG
jgi:hypothetical protein